MSREIKFRAWEKKLGEMIPVYSVSFDRKAINLSEDWQSFHEIELMQFTGFKDKNGTEIYEGDILKSVGYPNQKPQYIVKFGEFEDSPDHYHVSKHIGWYVEDIEYQDEFNNSLAYIVNDLDCVVCGNIYENKELLEEVE